METMKTKVLEPLSKNDPKDVQKTIDFGKATDPNTAVDKWMRIALQEKFDDILREPIPEDMLKTLEKLFDA